MASFSFLALDGVQDDDIELYPALRTARQRSQRLSIATVGVTSALALGTRSTLLMCALASVLALGARLHTPHRIHPRTSSPTNRRRLAARRNDDHATRSSRSPSPRLSHPTANAPDAMRCGAARVCRPPALGGARAPLLPLLRALPRELLRATRALRMPGAERGRGNQSGGKKSGGKKSGGKKRGGNRIER